MQDLLDHFPVFEANQVLTSVHLNEVFDYLDQQTRQTRSTLIGIGIVCGLEIKLETGTSPAIKLSRGCGVTSEGYLILEPDDVSLVSYRKYTLPADRKYPRFEDPVADAQYPLWELFPPDEPGTTPLGSPADFLDNKAVVLFLELKKQGLRNCSPNNCDDKGSEVIATVRRLLINIADLDKVIAAGNALGSGLTQSDLDSALSAKLDLPDIRVARFDVLNSSPATANDVYAAFLEVFRSAKLAEATAKALSAAHAAFKPMLLGRYPADPFGGFAAAFGFLDTVPTTPAQVRFLQYYVDLFEDLVRAYDEFRWKGAELICACCPPDDLFPRHLMLGLLHPEQAAKPGHYRQGFLPSPAISNCSEDAKELLQLFSRLVEMAGRFTNAPGLPKPNDDARIDPQIRITPSVLGDRPMAAKAIPYYYKLDGTPPLHHLWSVEKTRRHRATLNLGYRSDEYSPAAPAFVLEPLRYDLEPYDFLRIEGHLGKDYQAVLKTLLLLKAQYRLPIDIIALRSGVYDDAQPVDLTKEAARFQDLEAVYDSLREDLLTSLAEGAMSLYDVPVAELKLPGGSPKLSLLKSHAPNYRYSAGTVGAWYEKYLTLFQSRPYIDINQNAVDDNAVLTVYCTLFTGTEDLPAERFAHAVSIYYFSKLAEIMPGALDALAYADFENKYQDLVGLVRYFRSEAVKKIATELQKFIPQEDLIDRFDEVLFDCKLGPVRAIHEEFVKRVGELKKRQFLANFLQRHPGIQHKAGVPLGGTFIIVYHAEPAPPKDAVGTIVRNAGVISEGFTDRFRPGGRVAPETIVRSAAVTGTVRAASAGREVGTSPTADARTLALADAINRIGSNSALTLNPDINLVIDTLRGRRPIFEADVPGRGRDDPVSRIIASTVDKLADGTVIADFFLPYQVSSDGPAMQFVLPKPVPSFTATVGCANADGVASVALKVKGGVPPYDVAVDQGGYQAIAKTIPLSAGTHSVKVRDAEGTESAAQAVVVAEPITFGEPTFQCSQDATTYTATFSIKGGTPPFAVGGAVISNPHTTGPIPSGTKGTVEVADSNKCTGVLEFIHTCPPVCTLPCAGITLRRGHPFWLPEPDPNNPYEAFRLNAVTFNVEAKQGQPVQLGDRISPIIVADGAALRPDRFAATVQSWLDQINKIIANDPALSQPGAASWLTLGYEKAAPGRLGTLTIEHFECLSFDIQLTLTIARTGPRQRLMLVYTPKDTRVVVDDAKALVPAFEGVKFDKCNPNAPVERLCPRPLDITLAIAMTSQDNRSVVLTVTPSRPDPELAFYWEVDGGTPAVGNGQTFTTAFADARVRIATVTGFTKAGCMVTASTRVPVR